MRISWYVLFYKSYAYFLDVYGLFYKSYAYVYVNFQSIPSFAIVPAFKALGLGGIPGLEINLANVLHGEQYIKIHKPFDPDGGQLSTTARIGDIMDKGKHMVFATELETRVRPIVKNTIPVYDILYIIKIYKPIYRGA